LARHTGCFCGVDFALVTNFNLKQWLACEGVFQASFSLKVTETFVPLQTCLEAAKICSCLAINVQARVRTFGGILRRAFINLGRRAIV